MKYYEGNFGSRDIYGNKKSGAGTGFFIKFKTLILIIGLNIFL